MHDLHTVVDVEMDLDFWGQNVSISMSARSPGRALMAGHAPTTRMTECSLAHVLEAFLGVTVNSTLFRPELFLLRAIS